MAIPFLSNIDLNKNQLLNHTLHNATSNPSSPSEGQIYYNTSTDKVLVYNGSAWVSIAGDIESVGTTTASQLTVTNGTGPDVSLAIVTGAVANGGTALATGDQIYDFVIGQNYLTGNETITLSGDVTGSGTTSITTTIAADAVEAGMLNNNIISGQTALTSGLAATDEFLISDAGTIKKMDVSVLQTYMQNSLTFTTDTTYNFSLAAVSGNATVLTLDASAGDDDTVKFEGTTGEIEITTPVTGDAGTVKIGLPDDVTIGNDLTVQGDLTVNGATTTISTTNLNVEDALIGLQAELTGANTNDIGIIMERGTTGNNAAFIWDESADKFTLGTTTATAASTGSISVTAGTLVADLEGNADTATALAAGQNFSLTGDVSSNTVSFDGTGTVQLTTTIQPNSVALGTDTTGNYVATVSAGGGINVSGSGSETAGVTVSHADTSSQASVNNSGRTYIQDITLDTYGHITSITSATETVTNTDTQLATAAALIDVSAMAGNSTASFTHGLASQNLIVQMYDTNDGQVVYADIDHTSASAISILFSKTGTQMVADGIGDIRVVVIDAKHGLSDETVTYS